MFKSTVSILFIIVALSVFKDVEATFKSESSHSSLICDDHEPHFFASRCCDNEQFNYLHLKEHFDVCAVPPKIESTSIADSNWIFLECLISKSVKTDQLTMTEFAQLMARNLTQTKRTAIIEYLQKNPFQQVLEDSARGNPGQVKQETKLDLFKRMLEKYEDAEHQVCVEQMDPVAKNFSLKALGPYSYTHQRKYWLYMSKCDNLNVTYPNIFPLRKNYGDISKEACEKSWIEMDPTLKNVSLAPYFISTACNVINSGITTKQELEGTINLEKATKDLIPSIWSKSLKEKVFTKVTQELIKSYGNVTGSISTDREDPFTLLKNKQLDRLKSKNISTEIRTIWINGITLYELAFRILGFEYEVCRRNDYSIL